jgi:hypothetical protein
MVRCAECKQEFSHRSLRENKKFSRLLEIWKNLRTKNDLNTQIPQHFAAFNPGEAVARLRAQSKGRLLLSCSSSESSQKKAVE